MENILGIIFNLLIFAAILFPFPYTVYRLKQGKHLKLSTIGWNTFFALLLYLVVAGILILLAEKEVLPHYFKTWSILAAFPATYFSFKWMNTRNQMNANEYHN